MSYFKSSQFYRKVAESYPELISDINSVFYIVKDSLYIEESTEDDHEHSPSLHGSLSNEDTLLLLIKLANLGIPKAETAVRAIQLMFMNEINYECIDLMKDHRNPTQLKVSPVLRELLLYGEALKDYTLFLHSGGKLKLNHYVEGWEVLCS